jgi:hypothetical protein
MKLLHEVLRQASVLARSLRFYFTLLIITRQVVCAATPPGAGCNSSSKTRYSIGSRPPEEAKNISTPGQCIMHAVLLHFNL